MKKLLHEQLRGWKEVGIGSLETIRRLSATTLTEAMEIISCRIEHEYIPCPRDDKDEPWRIGDEFVVEYDDGPEVYRLEGIRHIQKDFGQNHWSLVDNHGVSHDVTNCKRPAPKVVDSDNAEIKVGNTAWCTTTGAPCKIIDIDARSRMCAVEWIDSDASDSWLRADCITQREPDSLEKWAEVFRALKDNWAANDERVVNLEFDRLDARLTALIEKGA